MGMVMSACCVPSREIWKQLPGFYMDFETRKDETSPWSKNLRITQAKEEGNSGKGHGRSLKKNLCSLLYCLFV